MTTMRKHRELGIAGVALSAAIVFVGLGITGSAQAAGDAAGYVFKMPKPDPRAVASGLYIQPRAAAKTASIAFTVAEPSGIARKRWAVRGGLPIFRGELKDPTKIRLLDAGGKAVPSRASPRPSGRRERSSSSASTS